MTSSGAVSGKSKAEQKGYPELPEMLWAHLIGHNLTAPAPQMLVPTSCSYGLNLKAVGCYTLEAHEAWGERDSGGGGGGRGESAKGSYIAELFV